MADVEKLLVTSHREVKVDVSVTLEDDFARFRSKLFSEWSF